MGKNLSLVETKQYKVMILENDNKNLQEKKYYLDVVLSELYDKMSDVEDSIKTIEDNRNKALNCKKHYRDMFTSIGIKSFLIIMTAFSGIALLSNIGNPITLGLFVMPTFFAGLGSYVAYSYKTDETRALVKKVKRGEDKLEYGYLTHRKAELKTNINEYRITREEVNAKINKNQIAINKTKKFVDKIKQDTIDIEKPHMLRLVK